MPKIALESQLGLLAMRFRSTKDESARNAVADSYAEIVRQLIDSGKWREMPTFEEMLPRERMPPVFFIFWSIPSPDAVTIPERAKPTLVLEGRDDAAILKAVFPPRVVDVCKIRPTEGKSHLAEAARTHLSKHRAPVAVLLDTDTLDKETIRVKVRRLEEELAGAAGHVPLGIFRCVPHIESIFFGGGVDYKRIFPAFRTVFDRQTARTAPKRQLKTLLEKGRGPKSLSSFLDTLTSDEMDDVRSKAPIPEVIAFIVNNLDFACAP